MTKAPSNCCEMRDCALLAAQVSAPPEAAEQLARGIVEMRLGACVQQHPVRSTYAWNGSIEVADEILLVIKTTAKSFAALAAWIAANHPYEVPEVIATPIPLALPAYAQWVQSTTQPTDPAA